MAAQDWLIRQAIISKLTERGMTPEEAQSMATQGWVMQLGRDIAAGRPIPEGMKNLTKRDVQAYKQRANDAGVSIQDLFRSDFYSATQPNAQLPLGSGEAAPPPP